MRNELEMGVDGPNLSQPYDRIRHLQPGAMREVNGYRVSDMANATVLVFEGSAVPVGCGLEAERHHSKDQNCGQKPACDVRPIHQI
jgi:hypothetical protein